ncbi:Sodium/bile acid cotransporter [Collichthys lucidus]|uniref:Sodium/bile acid cotransporter n=1 Tax=Collichthys lucidus TaxID=240159 RepID=A0A4U5UP80_COLLU|nr:Sodium/bile acid cotransporter [Collichthys lucidus]
MNSTADLSPQLWPNESFLYNTTTDGTGSNYMTSVTGVLAKTINILSVCMLFLTMVTLGCRMEVSKIKHHIIKPKGVGIALLAQYGVMPLTAFLLSKVGIVIHCIVMTTYSTLLGLGMMPLMLYIYCRGFPNLVKVIPYLRIVGSLVITIIASSIGILINRYRPRHAKIIEKVGFVVMLVTAVAFVIYINYVVKGIVAPVFSAPLLAIYGLLPLVGYTFGYIIPALFKLNQKERRTIAMETGCQNNLLCIAILRIGFHHEEIGALALFPLVLICSQLIEASLFIMVFRCHQCFKRKKKDTYQPANTAEQPEVAMTVRPQDAA